MEKQTMRNNLQTQISEMKEAMAEKESQTIEIES